MTLISILRVPLCCVTSDASAGIAQLVEHLTCNQGVRGSIPRAGTTSLFEPEIPPKNLKGKANSGVPYTHFGYIAAAPKTPI